MAPDILEAQDVGLKVSESSNILVLTPTPHPVDINLCTDLLAVRPPDEINVWCLDLTVSPTDRANHWVDRVGAPPARFRMVTTGNTDDALFANTPPGRSISANVIQIAEPGNLTQMGIDLTSTLTEWDQHQEQTMICVHSITTLTQYAPFSRVFKFLHEVKDEVDQSNAVSHCHMDPMAHDDQQISTIKQLFDSVVEVDRENNWRVVTREFEAEGTGLIPTLDQLGTDSVFEDTENPETE